MNVLGQIGTRQCLPDTIIAYVGNLTKTFKQPKGLKYSSIDADADICVAGFDPLQGRTGCERTLRDDCHGQLAAASCVVDIRAEPTQGAAHGRWRSMWSRHLQPSHYIFT